MPIETSIATHFYWRKVAFAVVCAVLAVWGWYDLTVTLPRREEYYNQYILRQEAYEALQTDVQAGRVLTAEEVKVYETLEAEMNEGPKVVRPRAFDKAVQWVYIVCILWTPLSIWSIVRIKGRPYRLDESGSLQLPGGRVWSHEEIAGIDMSRWMAKSIAWVLHRDGSRVKLDAYVHKNLELIIGAIAHRFEPEKWQPDGKQVRRAAAETADAAAEEAFAAEAESSVAAEDEIVDESEPTART